MNKTDLLSAEELELVDMIIEDYEKIGYKTLKTSSVSGENLDLLKGKISHKVSVFFGHSGCGKSTLVNALQPGLNLRTSAISEVHLKGKHTTTFAQMFFWDFGGSVIDTPGVREFAMIDVDKYEIQHYFPEIFATGRLCKFHNCMHMNEPKCAVVNGVENGEILESRYATYLKLVEEAEDLEDK
jgi:ribosome biogenesis GTPase